MSFPDDPARRGFLRHATRSAGAAALAGLGGAGLAHAAPAAARPAPSSAGAAARTLDMVHTHTGEAIDLVFAVGRDYVQASLAALNRFLRDHYTGDVGPIDPRLFDLLHRVQGMVGGAGRFEVISGYRCPATNDRLRRTGGGGVARRSLHMDGQAIDVRCTGVKLADLRDAALTLRGGGVGYYPREGFVHLDTGRVRAW
jgi:uncharacterized protein YcbK (DUF882 family)